MTYYAYIMRTSKNTFYVGQTNNLERRVEEHKSGKKGAKYMRMFEDVELVYWETYKTRSEAMKREYELKQLNHEQKVKLVLEHEAGD